MTEDARVEPRTLKGFQDLLYDSVLLRKHVIRKIEEVFQRYAFLPLETPALEYLDVLLGTGGENTNKELFRLESPENEPIALRFDHTVPFARLLAQYPDRLKPPFRRYACGPVWRADKPGAGRFREFTQLDFDIAGAPDVAADAEIISVMCDVMRALGVNEFRVLVNNRKLIDALLLGLGIAEPDRQKHVLRIIDKLAKVGIENVRLELGPGRIDDSGDPIPGAHLPQDVIERLLAFIALKSDTRAAMVQQMESALPDNDNAKHAIAEMRELAACLEALGLDETHVCFDPSLARGLDYYTGPVFEMVLPQAPQFGSVMGGGRYDGLVARFLDRPIPGTGASVGLDRLLAALTALDCLPRVPAPIQVLIVTMRGVPAEEALRTAAELRQAGLRTATFFAPRKKMTMSNQLSHADWYSIPVAVILGEDEVAQGLVSIKDLREGKTKRAEIADRDAYREAGKTGQITVARKDMITEVQKLLQNA
ncbi:MAG TPA: histidine--tRNA ligase [Candidatus Hydrogenedentes bacterium]|nr:histidine--tRNA ligase [Candidatus Hydrogenedentota bacterium]HOL78293.1 histidine--tRNA ligase [Candidatus Hydrogenedentota bacterium]